MWHCHLQIMRARPALSVAYKPCTVPVQKTVRAKLRTSDRERVPRRASQAYCVKPEPWQARLFVRLFVTGGGKTACSCRSMVLPSVEKLKEQDMVKLVSIDHTLSNLRRWHDFLRDMLYVRGSTRSLSPLKRTVTALVPLNVVGGVKQEGI